MKRIATLTLAAALAALSFPAAAEAQFGVKARVYGGMSLLSGGDLNKGAEGMFNFYDAYFRALGFATRGEFTPAQAGFNLGGDLIFQFNPSIGLGLGAGYTSAALTSVDEFQGAGGSGAISHRVRSAALPLRLSFFYFLPVAGGEKYNVVFHAGLGYYLSRAGHTFRLESGGSWLEQDLDCSGKGLGFHGGIGLEIALSGNMGLILEAGGRYAAFAGFEGDKTVRNSLGAIVATRGKLYYFEFSPTGGTFPQLDVSDTEIAGPGIGSLREAEVQFTGLSVTIGVFLRF